MAEGDDKKETETTEDEEASAGGPSLVVKDEAIDRPEGADDQDEAAPAAGVLGATRYVMAGFFTTGIALAYVVGRAIASGWGKLADTMWVQKNMTFLARLGEEERSEYSTAVGAIIAIAGVFYAYRRPDVRQWTDEVASELAKVTWPDKAEVTNSTVVVIVTSAFATVYLALLDRFWGFVTNLVYGGS